MTTNQIDQMIYDYTVEHGGTPADLNYEGYPKSVCTSINDVVCHGIPCDTDVLHEGDIINVDCSTILDGYFSDSSRMFCIGEVSAERQRLVDVTRASVEAGLAAVKPWLPLSVMAEAVQKTVEDAGFSVVREYGGHGIGKEFHEDPFVALPPSARCGHHYGPGHGLYHRAHGQRRSARHQDQQGRWLVRAHQGRQRLGPVRGTARGDRGRLRAAELVAADAPDADGQTRFAPGVLFERFA